MKPGDEKELTRRARWQALSLRAATFQDWRRQISSRQHSSKSTRSADGRVLDSYRRWTILVAVVRAQGMARDKIASWWCTMHSDAFDVIPYNVFCSPFLLTTTSLIFLQDIKGDWVKLGAGSFGNVYKGLSSKYISPATIF